MSGFLSSAVTLLLVGLLLVSGPGLQPAAGEGAESKDFSLHIPDPPAISGDTIRVIQGDTVTLRWTADQPAEVHLHGYDIEAEIVPGTTSEMTFEARATGRFPITTHGPAGDHVTLQYLEVYPP